MYTQRIFIRKKSNRQVSFRNNIIQPFSKNSYGDVAHDMLNIQYYEKYDKPTSIRKIKSMPCIFGSDKLPKKSILKNKSCNSINNLYNTSNNKHDFINQKNTTLKPILKPSIKKINKLNSNLSHNKTYDNVIYDNVTHYTIFCIKIPYK